MKNQLFRLAVSAFLLAAAMGLATTGAARAQSVMKECGNEWKAAKANNTTNGMTWQQFLAQCRAQKAAAPAAASAPAATAPAATAPAAAPAPAPAPVPAQASLPKPAPTPMKPAARPTGAGEFTT